MNKNSPSVIFKTKYCLSLNSIDNKNKSLKYIEDRLKDVDYMFDYYSNIKKGVVGMFEYYMGHLRKEHVNLVMENGNYATKQDIKKLKTDYKKYIENSNLWKGILSFNPEYINENISLKTLEQKIAKEVMPQFLRYCGFKDIKNMSYVFSIHTNKKHPHIHLSFIEKKPNYLYCDKKVNYRRKGKLTRDEKDYLKRLIVLSIEREKYYTPLLKKTNEDIDCLKEYFSPNEKNFILNNVEEIFIEEKILKLGQLLKEYRTLKNQNSKKIKYNSINNSNVGKEIKRLTKEIKKYLFSDESSSLYNKKKDIEKDLISINEYFDKINSDNNAKSIIENNSIVEKKEEYIENYIFNAIVNHSLYKYEHISNIVKNKNQSESITIEDLIQEIAYQNSLKDLEIDDKERRKNILENYFKGNSAILKFPSKYNVEKAIKNINCEMEKAIEKFDKLFDYSNKK